TPSLHAASGTDPGPARKDPIGVKSAAFQTESVSPVWPTIRTRLPSKAAPVGAPRPLPVSVARTEPVEALTTVTDPDPRLGTQLTAPSKAGSLGSPPAVTVCRIAPDGSSLQTFPAVESVTQTFAPSQSAP